jgi:hypothetical protein
MNKDELKTMILAQIKSYEKMMEDNQDIMINLQKQIEHLKNVNVSHTMKMRQLTSKLRDI